MTIADQIQLIAMFVSVSCALPGTFLVLRKMSMMTDSITHTILLGIVIAYFIVDDLGSPLLIVGATIMGVITVWLTQLLIETKLVSEDSAIGLIFPFLFSIAIILISKHAGNAHLDTDTVLLGEIAFAPFDKLIINEKNFGAKSIYLGATTLLINLAYIIAFFKELKLVIFDPLLAKTLGISTVFIHYSLMTVVSFTAVSAFESVGSILVIAFMIGPPVTAYLLTDNLKLMLVYSCMLAAAAGYLGTLIAIIQGNISFAGSMSVVVGVLFFLAFLFSPKQGLLFGVISKKKRKSNFAQFILMHHINNHKNSQESNDKNGIYTIKNHLCISEKEIHHTISTMLKTNSIEVKDNVLHLTERGYEKYIVNDKLN